MGSDARTGLHRGWPLILALVLALVVGAGVLVGCSGDDEATDDGAATESTAAGSTEDTTTGETTPGGEGTVEILDEVPSDFPDIALPDGTERLQVVTAEVAGPEGTTFQSVAVAFDSELSPQEQYDFFRTRVADAGFEIVLDQIVQQPEVIYTIVGTDESRTVTVSGGANESLVTDFADAQNPFFIAVGPPASPPTS